MSDEILGASIALSGVFFAQIIAMFQAWLERRNLRKIFLRTKYEELADLLNQSLVWVNELEVSSCINEINTRSQPIHARKAYSLTILYFPELKEVSKEYLLALISHQDVILDGFRECGASAGAQAIIRSRHSFDASCKKIQIAREAFDLALENYSF